MHSYIVLISFVFVMPTNLTFHGMLQSEYPKYIPLLAKILECVLQKATYDDKIGHEKEVTTN